jgi:DNA helicase-2/ATP-dependent DNA helicase PcrA
VADKVLNKQQLQAVNHGEGPLLIIAGAGTGKTTVITERIKRLISEGKAESSQILALTFTEKAAKEMEERIDVALPYGYTQMWVMTFHSFCDRILRDEGIHIGLSPDYRLIMDTDIVSLLQKKLFDLNLDYFRPLGNPHKFISGMVQHFDRLRDEDISPEFYLDWINKNIFDELEKKQSLELARAYSFYQKIKVETNAMDFADLVTNTLKLFRERPNILKKYQLKFKYLLVDEYQDTNYAQNSLVNLLAGYNRNLTVVADDDQSIYRWRGAAVSNILQFRKTYPGADLVVLTDNYRSTEEILNSSYKLIQNNNPDRLEVKEKINKKLTSHIKAAGEKPEFLHFGRIEDEADGVAKKIKFLIENEKYSPRDFAILVRANAHALPFTNSLSRQGIPYQFLGPGRLFEQPEIKDLIAYLRVLKDFTDNQSLFRVLSMDFFALPVRDLISLSNMASRSSRSLFSVCETIKTALPGDPAPEISESTRTRLPEILTMINKHIGLTNKESAGQILFYFLQDSSLLPSILSYRLPIDEKIANNIMKFFNKLKSFESENQDASVSAVLDWIDLSYEVGESPAATNMDWTEYDAVSLLTIHSAKGLEFPVVFLVNLVSQRFPTVEKKEQIPIPLALIKEELPVGDYHLEEERRLFYVGMTRAKERLFLTAADFYGEGKRTKKMSPFIYEALGDQSENKLQAGDNQLSLLNWDKPKVSAPVKTDGQKTPLHIDYLSYSQIQTFSDCPLHYKAKYLLHIPSPPSAASSFGNTIHSTMREYHNLKRQGEKPDILKIYTQKWIPEGYHNARHAQLYFDKGNNYLQDYLKTDLAGINPVLLEESFTVPVVSDDRSRTIKIGGKIDRVDILPDGQIEIIDYKTSSHLLTEKQAAGDLQLSFYALAATLLKTPPFNLKPENVKLTLYYFDQQKKVSVFQSAEQLENAMQQILDYKEAIGNSDLNCSGSIICKNGCDYQVLCDIKGF